ncbi:MAG: hypothetical protein M0003_13030 [Acidithiobacillus sp.]|nr:hypothetical protein [Acidithiobacillus sp.]
MALHKASERSTRALQKEFDKQYFYSDGYLVERTRSMRTKSRATPTQPQRSAPHPRRQAGVRSSAASGDGNNNEPEPEPERPHQRLLDQADLADILSISKKTLQNKLSVTPHLLPKAIQIPGARGPRWTAEAVKAWLSDRPAYTTQPAPVAPKRTVGRPRLAVAAGKGGAS